LSSGIVIINLGDDTERFPKTPKGSLDFDKSTSLENPFSEVETENRQSPIHPSQPSLSKTDDLGYHPNGGVVHKSPPTPLVPLQALPDSEVISRVVNEILAEEGHEVGMAKASSQEGDQMASEHSKGKGEALIGSHILTGPVEPRRGRSKGNPVKYSVASHDSLHSSRSKATPSRRKRGRQNDPAGSGHGDEDCNPHADMPNEILSPIDHHATSKHQRSSGGSY